MTLMWLMCFLFEFSCQHGSGQRWDLSVMGTAPLWDIWWYLLLLPGKVFLHPGQRLPQDGATVYSVGRSESLWPLVCRWFFVPHGSPLECFFGVIFPFLSPSLILTSEPRNCYLIASGCSLSIDIDVLAVLVSQFQSTVISHPHNP